MELTRLIENILFVADTPCTVAMLVKYTNTPEQEVMNALSELQQTFTRPRGGLVVIEHEGKYTLGTNPDAIQQLAVLRKEEPLGELSRPALETLSVIAYRGPITKPEIEQIRGVNCSVSLRNLLITGLIEEHEQNNGDRMYHISMDFLRHLGVENLSQLPDYERLHTLLLQGKVSTEQNTPLNI